MGASQGSKLNEANWHAMQTVLDMTKKLKEWYFRDTYLDIEKWTGSFGNKDCLFFVNFNRHCFVLLYNHRKRLGFIADGTNRFRTETSCAKELITLLDIRLISCTSKWGNQEELYTESYKAALGKVLHDIPDEAGQLFVNDVSTYCTIEAAETMNRKLMEHMTLMFRYAKAIGILRGTNTIDSKEVEDAFEMAMNGQIHKIVHAPKVDYTSDNEIQRSLQGRNT